MVTVTPVPTTGGAVAALFTMIVVIVVLAVLNMAWTERERERKRNCKSVKKENRVIKRLNEMSSVINYSD